MQIPATLQSRGTVQTKLNQHYGETSESSLWWCATILKWSKVRKTSVYFSRKKEQGGLEL